jgi:hypothetical protein
MSRQEQNFSQNSIQNSNLQLTQAEGDAISIQNSSHVTIVRTTYRSLFVLWQPSPEIDWDWAGRVIKEQQAEVHNRLKYVLRDRAPLSLQLSEQPERVNLPALESERRLTIAGQDSELLDPGQLMIEVFGRGDIQGKLLILGTPGAGKTTVLLSLAEQVLIGAIDNPKTVIPIVFELSTWKNDTQSIQDWLIEQLYDLYGGNRKLKRYEQWLEQRVLLPLLDGLDELEMERQQRCMAKLNEFTRQYPQVVVCCRSKEFEESGIRLGNLRGAVGLEPLSDRQIQTYLQQVEREGLWRQIQETREMRQMLEPNDGEAGLLRVPLFVSLAAAIYDRNQPFRTKGELLERYIDRQLSFDVRSSDRRKELNHRKWAYASVKEEPRVGITRHYLVCLARQLQEIKEVNFLIERMQPCWLRTNSDRGNYELILGLLSGLIGGSVLGLVLGATGWISGVPNGLRDGLLLGLFLGIVMFGLKVFQIVWLLFSVIAELLVESSHGNRLNSPLKLINWVVNLKIEWGAIEPVENLKISTSLEAQQRFLAILLKSSIVGMCVGLINFLNGDLKVKLFNSLLQGVMFGLLFGLPIGLINVLKSDLKFRTKPNQGIQNSAQSFVWTALFSYAFSVILMLGSTVTTEIFEQKDWLAPSAAIWRHAPAISLGGIISAFIVSFFVGGGIACLQHLCLRIILVFIGSIPWDFVTFLNYCTERRLLQRIGGRYRFIHRELLEHFAKQAEVER